MKKRCFKTMVEQFVYINHWAREIINVNRISRLHVLFGLDETKICCEFLFFVHSIEQIILHRSEKRSHTRQIDWLQF
jgi:hypothetical protein